MTDDDTRAMVRASTKFLQIHGVGIPLDMAIKMRRVGIFAREYKGAGDYDTVRQTYWEAV